MLCHDGRTCLWGEALAPIQHNNLPPMARWEVVMLSQLISWALKGEWARSLSGEGREIDLDHRILPGLLVDFFF